MIDTENLRVRTSFTPLRMLLWQPNPVHLDVEVLNKTKEAKNYSITVKLPMALGFDKAGLVKEHRIRIGKVEPFKAKDASFDIYCKFNTRPGSYDIDVVVREHEPDRFDKTLSKETTTATLRVE